MKKNRQRVSNIFDHTLNIQKRNFLVERAFCPLTRSPKCVFIRTRFTTTDGEKTTFRDVAFGKRSSLWWICLCSRRRFYFSFSFRREGNTPPFESKNISERSPPKEGLRTTLKSDEGKTRFKLEKRIRSFFFLRELEEEEEQHHHKRATTRCEASPPGFWFRAG